MKHKKLSLLRQTLLICTLTSVFSGTLLTPIFTPQVQAESLLDRFGALFNNKRPGGAASGRSRAGATRSGGNDSKCSQQYSPPLMALVPESNEGTTTKEYPDLLLYIPFGSSSQSSTATFRLLDEQKKSVLKKPIKLTLPEKKGIVRFSLPATEKPLLVGQRYRWYFNVTCVSEKGTQSRVSVDGWIKRVEADSKLVAQLKQVPAKDQYVPYAENKIWHETVTQLAEQRSVHKQDWNQLLSLFGLEEFADAPIAELNPVKNVSLIPTPF
ncbi:DUF928 domain-containing protein [Trichormus sp. NMC-1]|uniref:DUF928 domain-containing protein n=1 Tax=Trichormus sp. NMC-1 TaxID=1853259 RepID=UPI0008DC2792|nr:DUF928 domain-containing protein [Trichormus sp. NMC-1]